MASGTFNLTSTKSTLKGKIEWSSSSNGSSANSSSVTASLYIARTDSYTTKGTWSYGFNVGGTTKSGTWYGSVSSSWICIATITTTVGHSSDGSGSCYLEGYVNGPSGTTMAGYGVSGNTTVTLDKIPRYLTITSHSISKTALNSVTVSWVTDTARDWTQYSLNGADWHNDENYSVASDLKSGTYTIEGLTPNTTYTVKTRLRRTDSGLWTESGTLSFTTLNIAKITSAPNINFGDSITIKKTNPSGNTNNIKIQTLNPTTTIKTVKKASNSVTITLTDNEWDTLYKKLGNSNSMKIRYLVETIGDSTYTNYVNKTLTLTGNMKTIKLGKNGEVKRAKVFVEVDSETKRAVAWVCVNGEIKRCI